MAIMSPADMPQIMKVRSEPMKKYVLSKLGYPQVNVELSEDQFEVLWRICGDFIAGYFPREQKLAVFYTQPLKSTYPLPKDAYWIQEVRWDPVTSRIDDVFGAESFLFCLTDDVKIMAADGSFQHPLDWKKHWKAITPYGAAKIEVRDHKDNVKRPLEKITIHHERGVISAYSNHVIRSDGDWKEMYEIEPGSKLHGKEEQFVVNNINYSEGVTPISIKSSKGCYYACVEGAPVLLH